MSGMSRADLASWLVRIADDVRMSGDVPLVFMDGDGITPAAVSLADELWLIASNLDFAAAMAAHRSPDAPPALPGERADEEGPT